MAPAGLALSQGPMPIGQVPNWVDPNAPVFDELVASHPYSHPISFTASDDGHHLYFAEGGSVALVEADPTNLPPDLNAAAWRVPVGKIGARPIQMALDPAFDPGAASPAHPYLYLAAGREGVWALQAGSASSDPHAAVRLDDSGNLIATSQGNRRWCDDIGFLTVANTTYLIALFGRKDQSRLRVYDLAQVRAAAALGQETGNEVSPLVQVKLDTHPSVDHSSLGADQEHAFGYAFAVDGREVYVAMGYHGLVKVTFFWDGQALDHQSPEWGPWFGTGSAYAQNHSPTGFADLYENVEFGSPPEFTHPPQVLDVAVYNRDADHHWLFAAMDHLGWCAFDLEATWDEDIFSGPLGEKEFHHEGKPSRYATSNEPFVLLYDDPSASLTRTYARTVDVVDTREDGQSPDRATLVVGTGGRNFLLDPGHSNDGRVLLYDLNLGPIPRDLYDPQQTGARNYSLVYDVEDVMETSYTSLSNTVGRNVERVSNIGYDVHAVREQQAGQLAFLAGNKVRSQKFDPSGNDSQQSQFTALALHDLTTASMTPGSAVVREKAYRPGRTTIDVTLSKTNKNLLVTSNNDGGLVPDGPLLLDYSGPDPVITTPWFSPTAPGDENRRMSMGVTLGVDAGFAPSGGTSNTEYWFSFWSASELIDDLMSDLPRESGYRWYSEKMTTNVGPGLEPAHLKSLFYMAPETKFNPDSTNPVTGTETGRHYYVPHQIYPAYNDHVKTIPEAMEDEGVLWATVFGNPCGLWALKLSSLQRDLDLAQVQPLTDIRIGRDNFNPRYTLGGLVTHPEFWNVPDSRGTNGDPASLNFIYGQNSAARKASVQTWRSDLFQLPGDNTENPPMRWVMAVASGYSALDEDKVAANPSWAPPQPFRKAPAIGPSGYQHMMVRLFDVDDPIELTYESQPDPPNSESASLRAFTILGPDHGTSAYSVKGFCLTDLAGEQRYFLAVADISGRLYVYDIGDLLYNPTYTTFFGSTVPGYLHFGAVLQTGGVSPAVDVSPIDSIELVASVSDDERNYLGGFEVDVRQWQAQPWAASKSHAFLYAGLSRVGIQVCSFDPDAGTLAPVGVVQTPGDATGLYITDETGQAAPNERLMFVGDYDGGIRIYRD